MADNRCRIRCQGCGALMPFLKHLGDGWYTSPEFSEDALNDWLEEHKVCAFWHDPNGGIALDLESEQYPLEATSDADDA